MKRFEVYRNIRKRAVIFGLPISHFAVMMVTVLVSLLIIIFSFSFAMILGALVFDAVLYMSLTRLAHQPLQLRFSSPFPKIISNKRNSGLDYGQD